MLSVTVFPWSPDFPRTALTGRPRPSGHLTHHYYNVCFRKITRLARSAALDTDDFGRLVQACAEGHQVDVGVGFGVAVAAVVVLEVGILIQMEGDTGPDAAVLVAVEPGFAEGRHADAEEWKERLDAE